jgi:putative sterol carrier protein
VIVIVLKRRKKHHNKNKIKPELIVDTPSGTNADGDVSLSSAHLVSHDISGFIALKGLSENDLRADAVKRSLQAAIAQIPVDCGVDVDSSAINLHDIHTDANGLARLKFELRLHGISGAETDAVRAQLSEALNVSSKTRCQPFINNLADHGIVEGTDRIIPKNIVFIDAGIDAHGELSARRRRNPRQRKRAVIRKEHAIDTVTAAVGVGTVHGDDKNMVFVGGEITVADLQPADFRAHRQLRVAVANAIKASSQDPTNVQGGTSEIISKRLTKNGALCVKYTMGIPGGNIRLATETISELNNALTNGGGVFVTNLQKELKTLNIPKLQGRHLRVIDQNHHINGQPFTNHSEIKKNVIQGKIELEGLEPDDVNHDAGVKGAFKRTLSNMLKLDLAHTKIDLKGSKGIKGRTKVEYDIEPKSKMNDEMIQSTVNLMDDAKLDFVAELKATARKSRRKTKGIKRIESVTVHQLTAKPEKITINTSSDEGFIDGSLIMHGIDEKTFNHDENLQEAMQMTLESLPQFKKGELNKIHAIVTGATQLSDGSLQVNYRVKLEKSLDDLAKNDIKKSLAKSFEDGGVQFLSSLKKEADRNGRRVASISRLKSIDSSALHFMTSRTRRPSSHLESAQNTISDNSSADINGIFRFGGISKSEFVKNDEIQISIAEAITNIAKEEGLDLASSALKFVGIRTQGNASLKISFKISTGGAQAGLCRKINKRVEDLCANGGMGMLSEMNKFIKSKKLDVKKITLKPGCNMKCVRTRLRSAVKSIIQLNRASSGLSDFTDAPLTAKGKRGLQLHGSQRQESVQAMELSDNDGEPVLVPSRSASRRRRLGRSSSQLSATDVHEQDDENARTALQRRRDRRKRRLRLKAGKTGETEENNPGTKAAEKDGTNGAEVNVDEQVSLRRPERRKASGKDGSNEQPQQISSRKNRRVERRKMRKTRAEEVADQGVTAENAEALGDWFFGEETGVKAAASNEKAKVKQKRSRRRTRRKSQTKIQQTEAEVDEL